MKWLSWASSPKSSPSTYHLKGRWPALPEGCFPQRLREAGLLRLAKDGCSRRNFLGEEWPVSTEKSPRARPLGSCVGWCPTFYRMERGAFPLPSYAGSLCLAKPVWVPLHPIWVEAERWTLCQSATAPRHPCHSFGLS